MKRVLILSQPLHNNYGGLLQAFALQKVVKSLGFDVVTNKTILKPNSEITFKKIIAFCYNKAKNISKKILRYKTATSQNTQVISQNTRKFIDNQHIENLSDKIIEQFDIFIVGSDQVFRKRWSPVTKYFLEDLQDRSDKIKHKTGLDVFEIMPEENYTADTKDISKCIFPSVSKWLAGF
ncbi:MAG: polysaccharide pyruvyl transferase family protein [Bacteroidales bacterium]|nr:polysaccharide pyruvyl transferase family protein [Bacteroidales bacterium]